MGQIWPPGPIFWEHYPALGPHLRLRGAEKMESPEHLPPSGWIVGSIAMPGVGATKATLPITRGKNIADALPAGPSAPYRTGPRHGARRRPAPVKIRAL